MCSILNLIRNLMFLTGDWSSVSRTQSRSSLVSGRFGMDGDLDGSTKFGRPEKEKNRMRN